MWGARPIATAVALVTVGGVVWLLAANSHSSDPTSSLPSSPAIEPTARPIGPQARDAASDQQQLPGTPDTSFSPDVDFRQPQAVARAYLVAAHTVTAADRGKSNRRVLPYLAPDNPANPRGLVVAETPTVGRFTVTVDQLTVVGSNESGRRIAYEARWSIAADESSEPGRQRSTFVVLARQPDGRWLVTQETARIQPGD
ncbi:hypothetical protein [Amycolatopsis palatopharyngis]|uniref:hypothetical protein n=1 Tax=Amycolatopsis palatopharyngis TaxID=187982 RepID=UPI000E266DEA|nr:hypothetical protein [Amycolatopsis palatopharyngis]